MLYDLVFGFFGFLLREKYVYLFHLKNRKIQRFREGDNPCY